MYTDVRFQWCDILRMTRWMDVTLVQEITSFLRICAFKQKELINTDLRVVTVRPVCRQTGFTLTGHCIDMLQH